MLTMPRGSAHEIIFAEQIYQPVGLYPQKYSMRATGGVYLGFDASGGRKFPHGNFRTTRVLRSQNTDCRKNDSFSTVSNRGQAPRFFFGRGKAPETDRKTRLRDTSQNGLHGEEKLHPSLRYGQMSLCRKHKNERIDFLIIGRLSEIVENSKKNVPMSRESSIINTIIRRDG